VEAAEKCITLLTVSKRAKLVVHVTKQNTRCPQFPANTKDASLKNLPKTITVENISFNFSLTKRKHWVCACAPSTPEDVVNSCRRHMRLENVPVAWKTRTSGNVRNEPMQGKLFTMKNTEFALAVAKNITCLFFKVLVEARQALVQTAETKTMCRTQKETRRM
jgi:hypothetical protein